MVSTCRLQEKYNQVQRKFCFYLDIHDNSIARTLSKRIEDLGLQQEYFLTARVTHVVRSGGAASPRWAPREPAPAGRSRADAMLQRVPRETHSPRDAARHTVTLDLQQAVILLDKIYDTFFSAPSKSNIRVYRKHFIKIEFLDKHCKPVFKEFEEWPDISLEPDPPRERRRASPAEDNLNNNNLGQKMTRKSRPRIRERDSPEQKGGYCEMCNAEYVDAASHRRCPQHAAFVRDHRNYLALDELIEAGGGVPAFLERERRSLRHATCNGAVLQNGTDGPKQNGLDDDKKHNTRCSKRACDSTIPDEKDKQYYKVVNTKLRSSGGFVPKEPKKEPPPVVNGTKPLVVKFKKIRRSELSVLSDEAEQFMFPKRASSTSSTSSDEEEVLEKTRPKSKTPPQPPASLERRRLARPVALKEESSEEDSWPEDKRRRKRQPPLVKRVRRLRQTASAPEPAAEPPEPEPAVEPLEPATEEVCPLREEPEERCVSWRGGRLRLAGGVARLQFSFESPPRAPWVQAFTRQDTGRRAVRDLQHYFSLYSKPPKLPYELGALPPLKPNCCPLSAAPRPEPEPGPARPYGTRGMKKLKLKKRGLALLLDSRPRKSPREHASTLAMLGAGGRRDESDTASEAPTTSAPPVDTENSDRLRLLLEHIYDDAEEYEMSDGGEGEPALVRTAPDLPRLVADCEDCDPLRDEFRSEPEPAKKVKRSVSEEGEACVASEQEPEDEDDKPLVKEEVKGSLATQAWLQPVVRVARVEGGPRLRSASGGAKGTRGGRGRRGRARR